MRPTLPNILWIAVFTIGAALTAGIAEAFYSAAQSPGGVTERTSWFFGILWLVAPVVGAPLGFFLCVRGVLPGTRGRHDPSKQSPNAA